MPRLLVAFFALAALLLPGLAAPPAAADAATPSVGLRYPSLTPDGKTVVFDYRGDIWRAPLDGSGHADRLTIHDAQDTLPRVSPDGTQIAFTSRRAGGFDLYVMPLEGGLPRQVTFHSGMELLCDWSPDGKRLLFLSNREPSLWQLDLYDVAVEGGSARRITRDGAREGCYTCDGTQILYVRGFNSIYHDNYAGSANYDPYVVDAAGGTPRRLVETPGNERWPFLSADCSTYYFVTEEQGVANLYKAPFAGGPREQVTKGTGLDLQRPSPTWDRTRVVFERGGRLAWVDLREAGAPFHEIALSVQSDVRNSGIEVRTITQGGEQVHVSPDGTQLAFTLSGDLWLLPSGGGQGTRLTSTPANEQWPRFSPDGRRLAFAAEKNGTSDIHLLDLASKQVTPLTKHAADDFFHAWSPDGTKLVFSSERSGNRDLWTIEVATGKETQLTDNPAADDDPVFSPDGRWIAFDSARDGGQAIYVMPAEGGAARRVTQGAGFFQVPTWSPDGSMLAFETFQPDTGGSGGLFAVAVSGGPHMQISRDGQAACWSRHGDWIYFHAEREGEHGLWRVPAPKAVQAGERITFLGKIEVDRRRELGDLFDEAWTRLKDGFYDPRMHGVEWTAMRAKYREMALDAENKETFYNVVNQMLAELGASHLGISPGGADPEEPVAPRGPTTGVLGVELDPAPATDGAREVLELFPGGPADKAGLRVGDRVVSVHGQTLKPSTDLDRVLAGTAGKEIKLGFRPLSGDGVGETRELTLTPTTTGALSKLYFEQWRLRSEKQVKEGTQGHVGYVHLDQMNPENLTRFQQAVARFNAAKEVEGLILDVRENGGGNIHVQLMSILQARPFVRLEPRGQGRITQPQLYWDKPVVLLVNERSFSDAEVFPWAFKAARLGSTVGVPTPGGVIGTNDVTLSDGSRFRIPRVGWYSLDGKNLEGHGFVPDFVVTETSADRLTGRDPQLTKAVEVVLAEIQARKSAPANTPQPGAGPAAERPAAPAPTPQQPTPERPAPERPTPEPTPPPERSPSGASRAEDPLADVKPGEWVRYRITMGSSAPTMLRYSVLGVEGGKVTFRRDVESGGGWLPPLPEQVDQGPLAAVLPALGDVRSSALVETQVGGTGAEGLLVTLDLAGVPAQCLFTNAVPALGLLKVEINKQVVMQAMEWGFEPASAAALPALAPVPALEPPAPKQPVAPERPATPQAPPAAVPDEGAEGGGTGLEIDNPLADAAVGEWLRFRQVVKGVSGVVTLEVLEVTETEVVIQSTLEEGGAQLEGQPLRRQRTRKLSVAGGRAQILRHASETLEVAGASVSCTVVTLAGRRGGPTSTTWYSLDVPVTGVVRRTRGTEVVLELLAWGRTPERTGS